MTYRPFSVRVAAREQLSPHFVRVTFAGPELAGLGWDGPDQRIKLLFPGPGMDVVEIPAGTDWYARWRALPDADRPPMRTYTTRWARPERRELVVDFVSHGDSGPATRWVTRARVGDPLVVVAPDGALGVDAGGYEWRPGSATSLLVAGDESAVPAIGAILESWPARASGAVFLEVPAASDALELTVPNGVTVTWLARGNAEHGALLDAAVRAHTSGWARTPDRPVSGGEAEPDPDPDELWEVAEEPAGAGLYAWLAGEAGVITGLRRHLVRELGIDRRRVAFMGYWKIGRAESE